MIGVIALLVSFLGLGWAITHQETAIRAFQVISGEPTATPMVITLPASTPLPTYTPYPTHTPYPTYTPHIVPTPEPTEALPTSTPVVVVVTATPTPKPTEPPGPILAVGETSRQDDVSLTLQRASLRSQYFKLTFLLKNESDHTIIGSYSHANFRVEDNLGNIYSSTFPDTHDYTLEAGKVMNIDPNLTNFTGDLTNKAIEWLLVTVEDISSFRGATWKIEVHH